MLVVLYFVLIGPPPISPEVTGLEDLATMTATDAAKLDGRFGKFRIRLNSPDLEYNGYILYECESADGIARTIWFHPDSEQDDFDDEKPIYVEARLVVIVHPARVIRRTFFIGFAEYRLMDARRYR